MKGAFLYKIYVIKLVLFLFKKYFLNAEYDNDYYALIMYNFYMSKKAERIIKDVNATMALEGMPLSDFDIELISKVIDGEITREEAIRLFNVNLEWLFLKSSIGYSYKDKKE